MISRKSFWILFLSVCGFTAVYLYYVKKDRENSIAHYFPLPQLGDIYKMQHDTRNGISVYYLKIKDIGQQSIYFYPGRMASTILQDNLMKHFDSTETMVYSKKELEEIVAGKWKNAGKDYTELIEIERK